MTLEKLIQLPQIPLREAYICADCEVISTSASTCPACATHYNIYPLTAWFDQTAMVGEVLRATQGHLPDSAAPDPADPFAPTADSRPVPSNEYHLTSSGSQLPDAPGDHPTPEEPRGSPRPEACPDGRRGYESDVTECPETGLAGIV